MDEKINIPDTYQPPYLDGDSIKFTDDDLYMFVDEEDVVLDFIKEYTKEGNVFLLLTPMNVVVEVFHDVAAFVDTPKFGDSENPIIAAAKSSLVMTLLHGFKLVVFDADKLKLDCLDVNGKMCCINTPIIELMNEKWTLELTPSNKYIPKNIN